MNRIITIGREFGSGGRELGRKLAAELDIPYYDQEILTQIAQKTELAEEYVNKVLETERFFYFPVTVGHSFTCMPNLAFDFHEAIYREQHNIIREMAARSDCIIIGRCADYILRDLHPLRLFVYASMQHKIERCRARNAEEADLSDKELKNRIQRIAQGRAKYYRFYTGHVWGAPENYDLCINTSQLEIDDLVKAILPLVAR